MKLKVEFDWDDLCQILCEAARERANDGTQFDPDSVGFKIEDDVVTSAIVSE